jgi:hypothetical protein
LGVCAHACVVDNSTLSWAPDVKNKLGWTLGSAALHKSLLPFNLHVGSGSGTDSYTSAAVVSLAQVCTRCMTCVPLAASRAGAPTSWPAT